MVTPAPSPGLSERDAVAAVLRLAQFCAARHWIPATTGNFSARIDLARAAVTATGADKTQLTGAGVITAEISGPRHPRLSAEGPLHLKLYETDRSIGAVAHAHPFAATYLSQRHAAQGALTFAGWEIQKALRGVTTHESKVSLPILANDQDMERCSALVAQHYASWPRPVFGFLLAGHGLYAWGRDAAEALRHFETYAVLLDLTLEEERAR